MAAGHNDCRSSAVDRVEPTLEAFFRSLPASSSYRVLVAFSGGPDSTALVAGLLAVAPRLGLEVHTAHLDHGCDPDSKRRARAARDLAVHFGVEHVSERLAPAARVGNDGLEATLRRARYDFLTRTARQVDARYVATAHHADDQAETVLLRLLFGSGLAGLAAIRPRHGEVLRPMLDLRRHELARYLEHRGLTPIQDPTNDDPAISRNRLRRYLLPRLVASDPRIVERLAGLAEVTATAMERIDGLLALHLAPRPLPHEPGLQVERAAFESLPEVLWPHALAFLHRRAGVALPAAAEARRELLRQLRWNPGRRAGCDCGGGWRWEVASGVVQLARRDAIAPTFAYSLEAPGDAAIPELGVTFRLRRGEVAAWMFKSWDDRAGLANLLGTERRVEVRNRRPGDRMRALGHRRSRRLKDLLIDRAVPRRQRDRLPLLVVDGEIVWIPGVAVAESCRLEPDAGRRVWIAEIVSLDEVSPLIPEGTKSGNENGRGTVMDDSAVY